MSLAQYLCLHFQILPGSWINLHPIYLLVTNKDHSLIRQAIGRDSVRGTNFMRRFCHLDFALYKIPDVQFITEPSFTNTLAMVQPL
jgi:hypothetical protein